MDEVIETAVQRYFQETACDDHLWVRRRDGKSCAYCGKRTFGSSELTDVERGKLVALAQTEKTA